MSKIVTTTVLPDVAGGSVTLGGTGASVVATGSFRLSSQWENDASQDAFLHGILVHGDLA